MEKPLTKQDEVFVETYAETGNGTQSVIEAFDIKDPNYAGVKAHRLLRKDKIINALEEALPDEMLLEVHREGLYASKPVFIKGDDGPEKVDDEPDYSVRHKYLDTAYKLKGSYAPEKRLNVNVEVETDPIVQDLTNKLNDIYRSTSESGHGGITSTLGTETQDKE